jgi:hypothetical protein
MTREQERRQRLEADVRNAINQRIVFWTGVVCAAAVVIGLR